MLSSKGGWEGLKPLERQHFVRNTPFRWTQIAMNKIYDTISEFFKKYFDINMITESGNRNNNIISEFTKNVIETANNVVKSSGLDQQMTELKKSFISLKDAVENNHYIKKFDVMIQKLLFDTSSGKNDAIIMMNEQQEEQKQQQGQYDAIIDNIDSTEEASPEVSPAQDAYTHLSTDTNSASYLRSTEEADDAVEEIEESDIEMFVRYMDEKRGLSR